MVYVINEWPKHNLKLDPTLPYLKKEVAKVTNISCYTFFARTMVGFSYIEKIITPEEFAEKYHVVCIDEEKDYYLVSETEYYELKSVKLFFTDETFKIGDLSLRYHGIVEAHTVIEPKRKPLTVEDLRIWEAYYNWWLPMCGLDVLEYSGKS